MARYDRRRSRGGSGFGSWLRDQLSRRPLPLWAVITADVLAFAVAILTFALFHHVLPRSEKAAGIVSLRGAQSAATASAATPEPAAGSAETATVADAADAATAAPSPEPTPETPVGVFTKFEDKFTSGEVVVDSTGYRSANVNIGFQKFERAELVYYVADIYIRDISQLRTAFANDAFGRGHAEWIADICKRENGVLAINGDYYGGRTDGIVIHNGELFRDEDHPLRDICIINWDGTMDTFGPEAWDAEAVMTGGAYQGWNFGPMLLDRDGNAMQYFNSDVGKANPRTAIGYYEPGHYCFVVVDGRTKTSKGITLKEFSQLFYDLGCARAYNLDGGQSSVMVAGGTVVSKPYRGGRKSSDAVLIVDLP